MRSNFHFHYSLWYPQKDDQAEFAWVAGYEMIYLHKDDYILQYH